MQESFVKIVGAQGVRRQEPLSHHSTFRIGGPADYFVMPHSETEIARIVMSCRMRGMPFIIIGNGSNMLFDDKGFRGCVIQLAESFAGIDPIVTEQTQQSERTTFYAKAGTLLSRVSMYAYEHSLTGLEFASGIPGSVGGAVLMNAGAYGGEMMQCVTASKYLDVEALQEGASDFIKTRVGEDQGFSYRHSVYQEEQAIILGAFFSLSKATEKEAIGLQMRELNARRREKQPLEYPSAGSTFKRPQGDYAARLIEAAGLKGYRVGDAMVSPKHSGFVVNAGKATAEDVLCVMRAVEERVFAESGIRLEPEIRIIKECDGWNL